MLDEEREDLNGSDDPEISFRDSPAVLQCGVTVESSDNERLTSLSYGQRDGNSEEEDDPGELPEPEQAGRGGE